MGRYTIENSLNHPGLRKSCRSTDAHKEHIHPVADTDWYCPGFLGNLTALFDRIERLEVLAGVNNDA